MITVIGRGSWKLEGNKYHYIQLQASQYQLNPWESNEENPFGDTQISYLKYTKG